MRLTLRQLNRYLGYINQITCDEALMQATAATIPHMDEEARADIIRNWRGIAGIRTPEPPRETLDDFMNQQVRRG